MGAHKRASFEIRKTQAIEAYEKACEESKRVKAEIEANMTDEDKKKRDYARKTLALLMGLAGAANSTSD